MLTCLIGLSPEALNSPHSELSRVAEDEGFEPSIGCPIHAFQACALGRYANPPEGENSIGGYNYDYTRSLVRRYRTELPQGRNAARVGPLWRVCEGSYKLRRTVEEHGDVISFVS